MGQGDPGRQHQSGVGRTRTTLVDMPAKSGHPVITASQAHSICSSGGHDLSGTLRRMLATTVSCQLPPRTRRADRTDERQPPATWPARPIPGDAMLSLPGSALATAMSSGFHRQRIIDIQDLIAAAEGGDRRDLAGEIDGAIERGVDHVVRRKLKRRAQGIYRAVHLFIHGVSPPFTKRPPEISLRPAKVDSSTRARLGSTR